MNLTVHLALILVSCLFGVNYVFSKFVLLSMPPGAWALARVFSTATLLLVLFYSRIKKRPPTGRQWLTILYVGFFGVIVNQISFFEGLSRTTPTHSAIINTATPIFVLFFSIIVGQERLNGFRLAGMALSVIGVLTVLEVEKQHFDSSLFLGDFLTLINSMSFGLYLVLARRMNRQLDPLVVTTGMFMVGTLGMALYGGRAAMTVSWLSLPPLVYGAMAYVILCASVGTYALNNWALAKTDSTMVALYIYIQPVVAGFLSRWLYHEELTLRMIVASLLVFIGVALGSVIKKEKAYA